MQITLVQTQIEQAIEAFVRSKVNLADGQGLNIDLMATRGDAGYTCNINIVDSQEILCPAPLNITETVKEAQEPVAPQAETEITEDSPNSPPPTPTAKKKSIFAGLEKPVNKKTDKPKDLPEADNEAA
jgi:hypothetical protein